MINPSQVNSDDMADGMTIDMVANVTSHKWKANVLRLTWQFRWWHVTWVCARHMANVCLRVTCVVVHRNLSWCVEYWACGDMWKNLWVAREDECWDFVVIPSMLCRSTLNLLSDVVGNSKQCSKRPRCWKK